MGEIRIEPVADGRARRHFVRLPARIFADDPHWVQPLTVERLMHLSPRHNPFLARAEWALWLAWRDGRPVGRISAQIDPRHLARHGDACGQFGFLDAIDDREVFARLLATAEAWLGQRGMRRVAGPFSFSINQESGLLIEGFERPPYMLMGHARPYYAGHLEALGYAKAADLFAYRFDTATPASSRVRRVIERGLAEAEVRFRPLDWGRYEEELALIVDIFNDAWSENWGFVPLSDAEVAAMARQLKPILDARDIAIAEVAGEAAAMAVTIPNVNAAIRGFRGRLLPFNWARLLWRLKVGRVDSVRLPLMGVRKAHQSSALGAALALGVIEELRRHHIARGVREAELSWVLEQNRPTHHLIGLMCGLHDKTYRVYAKAL